MLNNIKQFLWPIQRGEHKKFLQMMVVIACIIFNYTVLRNVKDALIITEAGAETVTFLKFWVVVPAAFIFFFIYAKLSNLLSKKAIFYTIVLSFLTFFLLFALVLYPSRHWLHPIESAEWLSRVLPQGLQGLVGIYKYWSYSLFYTLAEIWGAGVLSFLFWQFANDVTKVSEAKRFYAHFYLLGNVANTLAGYLTTYFSNLGKNAVAGVDPWQVALNYLMGSVVLAGVIALLAYTYLNRSVLVNAEEVGMPKKKSKPKMSMGESFKFLIKSRYLGLIAVLVMAYGISINLVEVAYKNQMRLQFPLKNDYNAFMGKMTMLIGIGTVLVILFGSSIIRRFGWKIAALATPWILGITGLLFFACMIFPDFFAPAAIFLGCTPLMLSVWFGFAQNVLSKSTKYALFDPTKEMAYIPLDDESKTKGKAAVDVVGNRLGKSGGAVMQQIMFAFIGPVTVIAPYSAAIMAGVIVIWIVAVYALNKRFTAISGEK